MALDFDLSFNPDKEIELLLANLDYGGLGLGGPALLAKKASLTNLAKNDPDAFLKEVMRNFPTASAIQGAKELTTKLKNFQTVQNAAQPPAQQPIFQPPTPTLTPDQRTGNIFEGSLPRPRFGVQPPELPINQIFPSQSGQPIDPATGLPIGLADSTREKIIAEQLPTTLAPSIGGLFQEENQAEIPAFEDIAAAEQANLEAARARALQEQQAFYQQNLQLANEALFPQFEQNLRRSANILGGRGLGSGGFEGSGALQELAKRGVQELGSQAQQLALPGLFGGQQQFSQLGLEAYQAPSIFRRSALERGLGLGDISKQYEQEKELARLGASAQQRAAGTTAKGSIFGSLIGAIPGIGGLFK